MNNEFRSSKFCGKTEFYRRQNVGTTYAQRSVIFFFR